MEYYSVLLDNFLSPKKMYWCESQYCTLLDQESKMTEEKIIECFKAIRDSKLQYTGNYDFISFDPKNNHLPDVDKKLVILEVSNGFETVGPMWISDDPFTFFKNNIPRCYFKLG